MPKILITGGRAPAALELARAMHKAGHTVIMAESARNHVSQPSNSIAANYLVPPPRQQTAAFIDALRKIINEQEIDLLLPTCEEVYYLAMGHEKLPCRVFVDTLDKLEVLHNKWSFARRASQLGLSVPETLLIRTNEELLLAFAQWREMVLKPVYSRFASRTLIAPTVRQATEVLRADPSCTWVAQRLVHGQQICTYSIVHGGHLTAHTAYQAEFTAGLGAAIAFEHIDHSQILSWVKHFVAAVGFTGQIAFDFIDAGREGIFAIECNPRTTSGLHLLAAHSDFIRAFFDKSMICLVPPHGVSRMLLPAMLIYGLPSSLRKAQFRKWLSKLLASRDVVFNLSDPMPFLLQWRSLYSYVIKAKKTGTSPLQASTFDIEWNGERVLPGTVTDS